MILGFNGRKEEFFWMVLSRFCDGIMMIERQVRYVRITADGAKHSPSWFCCEEERASRRPKGCRAPMMPLKTGGDGGPRQSGVAVSPTTSSDATLSWTVEGEQGLTRPVNATPHVPSHQVQPPRGLERHSKEKTSSPSRVRS